MVKRSMLYWDENKKAKIILKITAYINIGLFRINFISKLRFAFFNSLIVQKNLEMTFCSKVQKFFRLHILFINYKRLLLKTILVSF